MGRNEWGFRVKNKKELHKAIYLLRDFNRYTKEKGLEGEQMKMLGILRHKHGKLTSYYLLVVNYGWGADQANFILERWNHDDILLPFQKPAWWAKCQDYVWQWDDENPSVPMLPNE